MTATVIQPAKDCTASPETRRRISLARSILGHSEGREEQALVEVRAALNGASEADIALMRASGSRQVAPVEADNWEVR